MKNKPLTLNLDSSIESINWESLKNKNSRATRQYADSIEATILNDQCIQVIATRKSYFKPKSNFKCSVSMKLLVNFEDILPKEDIESICEKIKKGDDELAFHVFSYLSIILSNLDVANGCPYPLITAPLPNLPTQTEQD